MVKLVHLCSGCLIEGELRQGGTFVQLSAVTSGLEQGLAFVKYVKENRDREMEGG